LIAFSLKAFYSFFSESLYSNNAIFFQQHVDNVNKEIAYILETEGPEGHPLRKAARLKARLRWKKLGDVIRGAAFFKVCIISFTNNS